MSKIAAKQTKPLINPTYTDFGQPVWPAMRQNWPTLSIIVVGSLVLRLLWVLVLYPNPSLVGGDGPFYLRLADFIATGYGMVDSQLYRPTATVAPALPYVLAGLQLVFGKAHVVLAARLLQVFLGSGLVVILFALGTRWHSAKVGLLVALLAALDLRLIVESSELYTESLFIFCLYLSAWLLWRGLNRKDSSWSLALAGLALGVALLTRAVAQFLPFVWLLPLWYWQNNGTRFAQSRLFLQRAAPFLAGVALLVLPWIGRNWYVFKRPFLAEGAGYHLYENSNSTWEGNTQGLEKIKDLEVESNPAGKRYAFFESALAVIGSDPLAYIQRRATAAVAAYLQPHGTVVLGNAFDPTGLKESVLETIRGQRTWRALLGSTAFWLKSWVYVWHFGSITLAVFYCWQQRRNWPHWLWLVLLIGYLSAIYTLLLIIPRYLFPLMPAFLLLAAAQLLSMPILRKPSVKK